MNAIRTVLYVASALFVVAIVFVFLPWSSVNAFLGWFGPFAYPDDPIVQYTVKMVLVIFFWFGVLMATAVSRAEKYQLILLIFGLTFLSVAGFAFGLGWVYDLPWFFYLDGVSSAVVGALLLVYRSQAVGLFPQQRKLTMGPSHFRV